MIKYLSKILNDFLEDPSKPVNDPTAKHLFKVRAKKGAKFLTKEKAKEFSHVGAQLLFLANKAQHDIQTALAFLMTRIKQPTRTTGEN